MQPLALAHSIKEIQVIKAKALEVAAVAVVQSDLVMGQVQAGDEVVVQLAVVVGIQANGQREIRLQVFGVKANTPAQQPTVGGLAAGQHQADDEFIVEREQVGFAVSSHMTTQLRERLLGARDDFRVQLAQSAVDLQRPVVVHGVKPHHLVGSAEASKALNVGVGPWHVWGLINDEA